MYIELFSCSRFIQVKLDYYSSCEWYSILIAYVLLYSLVLKLLLYSSLMSKYITVHIFIEIYMLLDAQYIFE